MIISREKLAKRAFLAIALYSLFTYVFAHLAYMNMNTDTGVIFEYISLYIGKLTTFILPTAVTVIALLVYVTEGSSRAIKLTLAISSARAFYTLPYYYIIFIYNYGYDSIESLVLALLATVGIILATAIGAFVSIAIIIGVVNRIAKKTDDTSDPVAYLHARLEETENPWDFTAGANLVVLIIAFFRFACALIPEIIDTVAFLIEYKLTVTIPEILTITANYLLIFIMIAVSYILGLQVKKLLYKPYESTQTLTL